MQPTKDASEWTPSGNASMDGDVLRIDCACTETACGTWLLRRELSRTALTPDGILTVEDKDGLCVSIMLPTWLDDAMRRVMTAQAQPTLKEQAAMTGMSPPTSERRSKMKTTPKLQQLVEQLAAQYGFDLQGTGSSLALEQEAEVPWARLLIENLGAKRIKLSCQLYIFDEWVDEPAILFWTAPTGDWAPIEVTQIQGGWQGYAALDPQGDLEDFYDPAGQATLAHFAEEEVFVNLSAQGWLTNSRRVARPTHWPGCQSKHAGPCYGVLWQCAACGKTVCCAEGTDDHPEVCDACWVKLLAAEQEVDDVPF